MELEQFPRVRTESGTLSYGGSQDWYRTKWRRMAGCAATSAANLAAYYEVGVRPDWADGLSRGFTKEHYRQLMNTTFGCMKPGFMGFPWRDRYAKNFVCFAEERGMRFQASDLYGWTDTEEPFRFVKGAINDGNPVALLILTHRARELNDNTWHWMTITGYDTEKRTLLISNYGRREYLKADMVFEPGNDVSLITFKKSKDKAG